MPTASLASVTLAPNRCRRHSAATARIQRRFERWELNHLRAHCAELAAQVEDLQAQLSRADDAADFWARSFHDLEEHLYADTDDGRVMGLTQSGELLVVRTGAVQ